MTPPWWTEADAAETDLVVGEFVDAARAHRQGCAICADDRTRWCPDLHVACHALLDWLQHRMLESESVWLRRLEQQALALEEDPERLARMHAEAVLCR